MTMRHEYTISDKEKANEIAEENNRFYPPIPDVVCREHFSMDECYISAMDMAEWKNKQFEDYLNSVLYIKMLYFLNEKEKRENTIIDKMDWRETAKDFANYLKQQEENSETC